MRQQKPYQTIIYLYCYDFLPFIFAAAAVTLSVLPGQRHECSISYYPIIFRKHGINVAEASLHVVDITMVVS